MTGLLLIAVLLIWLAVCVWLARRIGKLLPKKWWGVAVQLLIAAFLLPLPLIDEFIAKPQFEALCREKAMLVLDNPSTQARTAWFDAGVRTQVPIGSLNAIVYRKQYVETTTGDPVYHYSTVTATGGWLVRALKISETNSPLIFRTICVPSELPHLKVWLGDHAITELPRPISK